MVEVGQIKRVYVDKFQNSVDSYLQVEVFLSEKDDILPCLWLNLPGIQTYPQEGDVAAVLFMTPKWGVVCAATDHMAIDINSGECKIFSRDGNGVQKTSIKVLNTGVLEIGGNGKHFVTYEDLDNILSNHTHDPGTYVSSGEPVTGVSGKPVLWDMSSAKANNVKTDG